MKKIIGAILIALSIITISSNSFAKAKKDKNIENQAGKKNDAL